MKPIISIGSETKRQLAHAAQELVVRGCEPGYVAFLRYTGLTGTGGKKADTVEEALQNLEEFLQKKAGEQ